jgi:hypothetical protein
MFDELWSRWGMKGRGSGRSCCSPMTRSCQGLVHPASSEAVEGFVAESFADCAADLVEVDAEGGQARSVAWTALRRAVWVKGLGTAPAVDRGRLDLSSCPSLLTVAGPNATLVAVGQEECRCERTRLWVEHRYMDLEDVDDFDLAQMTAGRLTVRSLLTLVLGLPVFRWRGPCCL